jgi:hypothetical protein
MWDFCRAHSSARSAVCVLGVVGVNIQVAVCIEYVTVDLVIV